MRSSDGSVFGIGQNVCEYEWSCAPSDSPGTVSSVRQSGRCRANSLVFPGKAIVSCELIRFALPSKIQTVSASQAAPPTRPVCQAPLQIERRAADDLEHIGSGGLLLERFAQLIEQSRDSRWR